MRIGQRCIECKGGVGGAFDGRQYLGRPGLVEEHSRKTREQQAGVCEGRVRLRVGRVERHGLLQVRHRLREPLGGP